MLLLKIQSKSLWDSDKEEFITLKTDCTLQLEHSLISLSRWEAKWKKPYLLNDPKNPRTLAEVKDYVRCMTINGGVPDEVYDVLSKDDFEKIAEYINDPHTATWFNKGNERKMANKRGGEILTSELIYYYMIANDIPWEAQKWHLNRLLTLIRICGDKGGGSQKKMFKKDILSRNANLNKARRAAMGSTG